MPRPSDGRRVADAILNKLLDRIEKQPERVKKVGERLPERSLLADDLEDLRERLTAAHRAGAVELVMGRYESSHAIERVVLKDAAKLYDFLGRTPPATRADRAAHVLRPLFAELPDPLRPILEEVLAGWGANRNVLRDVGPEDMATTAAVFRAAAALLSGDHEGLDVRTFSRRVLGDSKQVSRNLGRVGEVLRRATDLPPDMENWDVIESFGVQRLPQPCLVAGPLTYCDQDLPTAPYLGVAPEMAPLLRPGRRLAWVMTIENMASFVLQVRQALPPDAVAIYTGGFPSTATLEALRAIAGATDCLVYHWGDIDVGGLRIARRIERALAEIGRPLRLHLMTPDLARQHGTPGPPSGRHLRDVPKDSATFSLAAFLQSDRAAFLEQEELEPLVPLEAVPRRKPL